MSSVTYLTIIGLTLFETAGIYMQGVNGSEHKIYATFSYLTITGTTDTQHISIYDLKRIKILNSNLSPISGGTGIYASDVDRLTVSQCTIEGGTYGESREG